MTAVERDALRPHSPVQVHQPERMCVGCRVRASTTGLLRVVACEQSVIPDPARRLPGRGAWLHPAGDCVEAAERRRAFSRALKVPGRLDVSSVVMYVKEHSVNTAQVQRGRQAENA